MNRLRSIFRPLALTVLFCAPFLLFLAEWLLSREATADRDRGEVFDKAREFLAEAEIGSTWDVQLRRLLAGFQRTATELTEGGRFSGESLESGLAGRFQSELGPHLPPHFLWVAGRRGFTRPLWESLVPATVDAAILRAIESSGLKASFRLLSRIELAVSCPNSLEIIFQTGKPFPGCEEAARTLTRLMVQPAGAGEDQVLRKAFGFPLRAAQLNRIQGGISKKSEGSMLVAHQVGKTRILFWLFNDRDARSAMVGTFVDLEGFDDPSVFRLLIARLFPGQPDVAFLPRSGGMKPVLSEFFTRNPDVLNRALEMAVDERGEGEWVSRSRWFGVKPVPCAGDWRILASVPLPAYPPLTLVESFSLLGGFLLFIAGIKGIIHREWLRKGKPLGVGPVVLLCMISAVSLPGAAARFLTQQALEENLEMTSRRSQETLSKSLQRIEDRVGQGNALNLWKIEETCLKAGNQQPSFPSHSGEFLERTMVALVKACTHIEPFTGTKGGLFTFLRSDEKRLEGWVKDVGGDQAALGKVVGPFLDALLSRMNPGLKKDSTGSSGGLDMSKLKEEISGEFVTNFFRGILGDEAYYLMVGNPEDLVVAQTSYSLIIFRIAPILIRGVVKVIALVAWSDFNIQDLFLRHLSRNRSQVGENIEFCAVRKGELQDDFYSSKMPLPLPMWDLFSRTRKSMQPQRTTVLMEGSPWLMQTLPGKDCNLYLLGGMMPLQGEIRAKEKLVEDGQRITLLLAGTAFLIAWFLYRFSTGPLAVLGAELRRIAGGDFTRRISEERGDEFGSLARAFNRMACGLEEGRLLGKFVSSAVMSIVGDKEAFQKALEGELRPMTILFSGFELFPAEEKEAPDLPELVVAHLDEHLRSCSDAAGEFGGVIDKVIGPKVLMFFDHGKHGGGPNAARAALRTALSVRDSFGRIRRKVFAGIATGPVLAGILGARQVHLDFTVIGDTVNQAARLQAMGQKSALPPEEGPRGEHGLGNPGGEVLVEGSTMALLSGIRGAKSHGEITVKGKMKSVEVFEIP